MSTPVEILIIGSGVFGASLALELAEASFAGKADQILLLDRTLGGPSPDAASSDINKVVRQDYADDVYSKLAFEAIDEWNKPRWSRFYHEAGTVIFGKNSGQASEFVKQSYQQQLNLGVPVNYLSDSTSIRSKLPPAASLADFDGCVGYHSHRGGWAWATGAMQELTRLAAEAGCRSVQGTVRRLLRDGPRIAGVELEDGGVIEAAKTVLAAGSWSPSLLPELQSSCTASGQCLATIRLLNVDAARYRSTPILMNLSNHFYLLPPNDDNLLKFAFHGIGFTNPQQTTSSDDAGGSISIPRTTHSGGEASEGIPRQALAALREAVGEIYPELAAMTFDGSRLCWYSDTPDANWIIGHHPTLQSLFIATGGSGHAFKFLPILGRYLRASFEGTLDPKMQDLWSPSRPREDSDPARPGKEKLRQLLRAEDLARTAQDYRP